MPHPFPKLRGSGLFLPRKQAAALNLPNCADGAYQTRPHPCAFLVEDAATEFQVQGLELDWACVTWDADLRFAESDWKYHAFKGSKWETIHKPDRRQYLRNAYRVLLTRARQGMVIFLPTGDKSDPTRTPAYYDATFEYLASIGLPVVESA